MGNKLCLKLLSGIMAIFGVSGCALSMVSCAYGGPPVDPNETYEKVLEVEEFEEVLPIDDSEEKPQ